jgi:hypothetical protein
MSNPMQYSMKPMHHRGMDRRHHFNPYPTEPRPTAEEQEQRLGEIRERLYRHLDLMDGLQRVRTRMVRPKDINKD